MRHWWSLFLMSLFLILLLSLPLAADETWYVNTDVASSGDGTIGSPYKYLSNFVAVQAGSMTGRGKVVCYLSGATNDTTAVGLGGFTNTSATDHLELIVSDPWQGTFDDSKYYLRSTAGYSQAIADPPAYTVIRGFQVSMPDTNSNGLVGRANVYIDRCLLVNCGRYGIVFSAGGAVVNNCLIEASGSDGMYGGQNATIYNTTVTGCGGRGFAVNGYVTWTLRNCVSAGNTDADFYKNNATVTLTNCYSEDGTLSTPTIPYTTATFVNVSSGTAANRHLVAGSGLIGAGADLSSYTSDSAPTTVDIDGDARPQNTTWDVGADEYVAAAATAEAFYYQQNQ